MKVIFFLVLLAVGLMACADCPDFPPEGEPVEIGKEYLHKLGTHCGIDITRFDGRVWRGHPPPHLSGNNAPRGWSDNESGLGTTGVMMLVERDVAQFTNFTTGESVYFTPWPPSLPTPQCN